MNAASTPYDPGLARRMGRMYVSATRRTRRGQTRAGRDRLGLSGTALGPYGRGGQAA